jgi:PTH2 family peptidyl-tRNA hydrolase
MSKILQLLTGRINIPIWTLATSVLIAGATVVYTTNINKNKYNNDKVNKDKNKLLCDYDEDDELDDFDDEENEYDLNDDYTEEDGPFKMVLCVNMSLGMQKGKIAAQCGHATLGSFMMANDYSPSAVDCWFDEGQAKIALKVPKEEDIFELLEKAKLSGLATCLVEDEGRTQIAKGSRTVLAIGPAPNKKIDELVSHLKLL